MILNVISPAILDINWSDRSHRRVLRSPHGVESRQNVEVCIRRTLGRLSDVCSSHTAVTLVKNSVKLRLLLRTVYGSQCQQHH